MIFIKTLSSEHWTWQTENTITETMYSIESDSYSYASKVKRSQSSYFSFRFFIIIGIWEDLAPFPLPLTMDHTFYQTMFLQIKCNVFKTENR